MLKYIALSILLVGIAIAAVSLDVAPPDCHYDNGQLICSTGGGGDGGGGGGGGGGGNPTPAPTAPACVPDGTTNTIPGPVYMPATDACYQGTLLVDSCGTVLQGTANVDPSNIVPCSGEPDNNGRDPIYPCLKAFSVTPGGVFCDTPFEWEVKASVGFPPISLDARPYPATLVRWDTALRLGDMPPRSGSGHLGYAPLGGGSEDSPRAGDWRDIILTLTLAPAQPFVKVDLPNVGRLTLPLVGPTGNPTIFHWDVPSHPAVGGSSLAGKVGQLQELPPDFPLFLSASKAAYRLTWSLKYYKWESTCVDGADSNGVTNCRLRDGVYTGHREWGWKHHSEGGEIPPSAVANLPASMAADLNGDGVPDAYWDRHVQIRRMDDANRIDNPLYARTYSWGEIFFYGVREGQGQVGWPGSP